MKDDFKVKNLDAYRRIWTRIHAVYVKTHMVSEHSLQAVLYGEFLREFPDVHIAVEPYCNGQHPDLVVVRNSAITDIFELKYAPGEYAVYEDDICKLSSYVAGKRTCYVSIDPVTGYTGGNYAPPLPVPDDCRLHFVVVSRPESLALDTANLTSHLEEPLNNELYHWKGRSGKDREWEVELVER